MLDTLHSHISGTVQVYFIDLHKRYLCFINLQQIQHYSNNFQQKSAVLQSFPTMSHALHLFISKKKKHVFSIH